MNAWYQRNISRIVMFCASFMGAYQLLYQGKSVDNDVLFLMLFGIVLHIYRKD